MRTHVAGHHIAVLVKPLRSFTYHCVKNAHKRKRLGPHTKHNRPHQTPCGISKTATQFYIPLRQKCPQAQALGAFFPCGSGGVWFQEMCPFFLGLGF